MADEYGFKHKTCYCGLDLSGLKVVPTSFRYGTQPQAKCPECGRSMLLDAPPVEDVMSTPAPPAEDAPAPAKSKSKK